MYHDEASRSTSITLAEGYAEMSSAEKALAGESVTAETWPRGASKSARVGDLLMVVVAVVVLEE